MKKKFLNQRGITLIALVITIVILLILAGTTIATLTGDNGILTRASEARDETEKSKIKDEIALALSSVQIQHTGNLEEVTSEELQNELGEQYIVYPAEKFEVYNKMYNYLYRITSDNSIEYIGEYSIQTTTKTGNSSTPVILSEKGVDDVKLEYSEGQNISILGVNRFNIDESSFAMISYNSKHTITKENNGITIKSEQFDTTISSCYAYTDVIAEFSGKIWVSCEASSEGDIEDVGMRVRVNDESQELCRGEGKLAEAINVQKGDKIRLIFYFHICTSEANTISYKNIMIQYEDLTDFVPYEEEISSIQTAVKKVVLDGSEGIDAYTTAITIGGGTNYRYTNKTLITNTGNDVLPINNDTKANVKVKGLDLVTYNETYNNKIGIGISSTGTISIYLGSECSSRDLLIEYLKNNPIEIEYNTLEQEFIGIDSDIDVSTGNIIISDDEFSVSYSYISPKEGYELVCFGDSITGMFQNETDYPSMITNSSNIKTYNVGFSGCEWTDHTSANYMPFSMNRLVDSICSGDFSLQESTASNCGDIYVERLNTLKNIDFMKVDYVTIFYGTNDWGSNSILKSEDDLNTSEKQRTNVEDAMKYSVSKLKEKYPNLEIIIITPYWRYLNNNDSDTVPNSNGDYLYDYSNYMEDIAYNDCKVQTINFYNELDINISNYLEYLPDGTHPNEKLKHIIATYIINKINN